jgi:hypothetical protein
MTDSVLPLRFTEQLLDEVVDCLRQPTVEGEALFVLAIRVDAGGLQIAGNGTPEGATGEEIVRAVARALTAFMSIDMESERKLSMRRGDT